MSNYDLNTPFPDGPDLETYDENALREGLGILLQSEIELTFIRHGESEANKNKSLNTLDEDLTEKGITQAEALARSLRDARDPGFDHIFCSPLLRASRTARIISNITGHGDLVVIDHLQERKFSGIAGKLYSEITDLANEIGTNNLLQIGEANYILTGYGIETFPELKFRAGAVLAHFGHNLERVKGERGRIMIVSHGDMSQMLIANVLGLEGFEDSIRNYKMPNAGGYVYKDGLLVPILNPLNEG